MREFHISKKARDAYGFDQGLFSLRGRVILGNLAQSREFTKKLMHKYSELRHQDVFAMGLIDEILHYVIHLYGKDVKQSPAALLWEHMVHRFGQAATEKTVKDFSQQFPPLAVYQGSISIDDYFAQTYDGVSGWAIQLEEMLMLWLENKNPAYSQAAELFDDKQLSESSSYQEIMKEAHTFFQTMPFFGPDHQNLIDMLRAPAIAHPDSLDLQLEYIRQKWGYLLGDLLLKLLRSIDFLKEANAYFLKKGQGGVGKDTYVLDYHGVGHEEYERFSPDRDWMPRVVLLAKTTLVWLFQLSRQYNRPIHRLDEIPDEELDRIADCGFNSLWLIGLWERSDASRKIKHRCGNPDAAASAYSLNDYDIAYEIGGWAALENLRWRAWNRGIRLASDMVPNHTGMESKWVTEHPDWFVQVSNPPFPSYTYHGEDLSSNPDIGLYLEDHYYNQSDAAVTFKRVDRRSGETRYIYHGNDGTHMPWNDTAQLNFLKAEVREAVIQTILHVAKNFPIIRFDAAMTLAKRHIQRLWFPEPGHGGDIASRAEHGLSAADFNAALPTEFWREVVDRVAVEAPDTLLLAEAFWMMEGYFVRTLGMHRVYNSAFMNMLKNEENGKYRQTIKNTIGFDKDILKRFVNFMNNPDEDTAIAQFGSGDKYFGVCTLMSTMPGLPMFGHGQIEGYTEKYGMEYRRAYRDELPSDDLIDRHNREVFPLLKKRYLFADVENFCLFDLYRDDGSVNENVFAYTNSHGSEHAFVVYNNAYESTYGTLRISAGFLHKGPHGERHMRQKNFAEALGLRNSSDSYTVLREQRSGLWYLRRSSDLYDQGMRIVLNGYQSQVYLEIHELHDNEAGHYKMLHEFLGGAGVQDLQAALRELVLRPIYDAFAQEFSQTFWVDALSLFDKVNAPRISLIDGLMARYTSFVEKTISWAKDEVKYKEAIASTKYCLEACKLAMEFATAQGQTKTKVKGEIPNFLVFLHETLEKPEYRNGLLAFLLFGSLYPENEEWQLHYRIQGIGEVKYQIEMIVSALHKPLCKASAQDFDIISLIGSLEVQEYLGVHYYDGVRWYNKERFENFMWWYAMVRFISLETKTLETVSKIAGEIAIWQAVHEKAGFKFDTLKQALLSHFEEPKPVKKSSPKKESKEK